MAVYILHFETPLSHAQHYIGYTNDVERRFEEHKHNQGGHLPAAVVKAGIGMQIARVFPWGDRAFERKLKERHNGRAYCPICREAFLEHKRQESRARRLAKKGGDLL